MSCLTWRTYLLLLYCMCFCCATSNINKNNNNDTLLLSDIDHNIRNYSVKLKKVEKFKLLILHTNDMHSRILETSLNSVPFCGDNTCYGGFARVKKLAKELRDKYELKNWAVLFLNAGDNFQGSPLFSVFKWQILSELIPDLEFDVMSLGNHEFDDDVGALADYITNLKSPPVVGCNLDFSQDNRTKNIPVRRSKIFNFQGTQVAVIGYLTPDTQHLGYVGNVSFESEIDCLQSEVTNLKLKNVDIIIALGHSGYEMDKRIAAEVDGIDLVVGGHSHSFLWSGENEPSDEKISGDYPTWIKRYSTDQGIHKVTDVPVVQAYAFTKYLGFLKMKFTRKGESEYKLKSAKGNPILLTSDKYEEDLMMKNKIMKWQKEITNHCSIKIGDTTLPLEGDGSICRTKECTLGNLVADSFTEYGMQHYTSNTTMIALVHSGSIRTSISPPNGNILYRDVLSALPFSNKLTIIKLKGKHLHEVFEHSISGIENDLGRFLQISGVKVEYDINNSVGNRVKSIHVLCTDCSPKYSPIVNETEYNLVIPDYLLKGGDDHVIIKENHEVIKRLGVTDLDVVLQYLKQHSPVQPRIEGRIVIRNGGADSLNR